MWRIDRLNRKSQHLQILYKSFATHQIEDLLQICYKFVIEGCTKTTFLSCIARYSKESYVGHVRCTVTASSKEFVFGLSVCNIRDRQRVLVAQLDRVSNYGFEGWEFEPFQARREECVSIIFILLHHYCGKTILDKRWNKPITNLLQIYCLLDITDWQKPDKSKICYSFC